MSFLHLQFSQKKFTIETSFNVLKSEGTHDLFAIENKEIYKSVYEKRKLNMKVIKRVDKNYNLRLLYVLAINANKHLFVGTYKKKIRAYFYENETLGSRVDYEINSSNTMEKSITFGRFYHYSDELALLTIDKRNQIKFYAINFLEETPLVRSITTSTEILEQKCPKPSKMFSAKLGKSQNEVLVCWQSSGLNIFSFQVSYRIKFVENIQLASFEKTESEKKIFFPRLSRNEDWNDIAIFNSSGLFVLHSEKNSYKLLNYNPMFATVKGWSSEHLQTIRFEDIDNDGSDELIFTGTSGIEILSYIVHANKWMSLLNTEHLAPIERHTKFVHALAPAAGRTLQPTLISYHSGYIHFAEIVAVHAPELEIPKMNPRYLSAIDDFALVPESIAQASEESRSMHFLRDQNIWLDLLKSVNIGTGRPKFVLPLVDEPYSAVKLHLSYDGTQGTSEPLGSGWSMPQNFIILQFQPANFEEDETYILVVDSVPHVLKILPDHSTELESVYELGDEEKIKIRAKFNKSQGTWQVDLGTNHVYFYGSFNNGYYGAVLNDISWKNWRAPGFDEADLEKRENLWYLAYIESEGKKVYYEYEIIENQTKNRITWNVKAFLKSILDEQSMIRLFYSTQNLAQHNEQTNDDKIHYLTGYRYTSKTKEQTVFLKHSFVNDSLLLTAIEQKDDCKEQPVVQFQYLERTKGKHLLEKIKLPNEVEIGYNYDLVGEPDDLGNIKKEFSANTKFVSGLDFTIASSLEETLKTVEVRMFNQDLSEELRSFDRIVFGERFTVEMYEILLGDSFVAIVVVTASYKRTYAFGRFANGTWQATPNQFDSSDESTILGGADFVLVSNTNSTISLIEWSQGETMWKHSQQTVAGDPTLRSVTVFGNRFLIYDNQNITLGYRPIANVRDWKLTHLTSCPDYLSSTREVLRKFDTPSNFEKTLFGVFRNNAIQMSHNIFAVSKLALNGNQGLLTKIRTFIIGRDRKVHFLRDFDIIQDNFESIQSAPFYFNNKKVFLNYVYDNNKIKLRLKEDIKIPNTLRMNRNLWREIYTKWNNPAKHFLLDLRHYTVALHDGTIICRNVAYSFGGLQWHNLNKNENSNSSISIPLGDEFSLKQENLNSNVTLRNRNSEMIFDLGVMDMKNVQLNYPIYIAAQENYEGITFIEFNADQAAKTTLPKSLKLSPQSNSNYLIASLKNESLMHVWPMNGIRRFLPNLVIQYQTISIAGINLGGKKRVTGYEYERGVPKLAFNNLHYSEQIMVPGNDKKSYGYVKFKGPIVHVYNGDEQRVKTIEHKNEEEESEEAISRKNEEILFGRNGRPEIAAFTPFSTSSDMGGYIGFENYESSSNKWNFNRTNVVRGKFALTGQNYLRLQSESMQASFRPKMQDSLFVISTWIRTPRTHIPRPGDIVPYLRASVVLANNREVFHFLADVKFQISDWSFLEVVVDLNSFHLFSLNNGKQTKSTNRLEIDVRISPSSEVPIDVDNVRFSALNNIFEVKVYDLEVGKPIATIAPNGAILRHIYDKYEMMIAEVNESNQIKEFNTYTKSSHLNANRFGNPQCEIKLIPEMSIYEHFSPISFAREWRVSDNDWTISPFTLQHHKAHPSSLFFNSKDINLQSFAIRFVYKLKGESSLALGDVITIDSSGRKAALTMRATHSMTETIPLEGEFLLVKEESRIFVWIDGGLYIDQDLQDLKSMNFEVSGEVRIQHMMIFSRPQVEVTYKNALNEVIQKISLSSGGTAIITAQLYDDLGRQRITVQTVEVSRTGMEPLLSFATALVTNTDPDDIESVWKTGRLKGEINEIVKHEFGFSEIGYDNSPLNIQIKIGLPGEKFAVSGAYSQSFSTDSMIAFLERMYPSTRNFIYRASSKSPNVREISIFNEENQRVALFIREDGKKDMFSTFEYNESGKLIQIVPPMYYSHNGMFQHNELRCLQSNIGTEYDKMKTIFTYNEKGNPKRKTSPDTGPIENIYDDQEQLRFIVQYSEQDPTVVEYITCFSYDAVGRLSSSGKLKTSIAPKDLLRVPIPDSDKEIYQQIHHSDNESDAAFRGKLLRSSTQQKNWSLVEESILDNNGNVISKRYIIPNGMDRTMVLAINNRFDGRLLKEVIYPATMFGEPFRVAYEYDRLGRMTSVGIAGHTNRFLSIAYNARNQVIAETFTPHRRNKFTREYKYNEPGFLTEINDPFLHEEISYTEKGYSSSGHGDGSVIRTKFTAKWHQKANSDGIGVRLHHFTSAYNTTAANNFETCLSELKNKGYLDADNQQTKVFYPALDGTLSPACTQHTMAKQVKYILGKYGFPKEYGFRFEYGSQMEFRKAKYFVGTHEPRALREDTFANEISQIDSESSKEIWKHLTSLGYILAGGKRGKDIAFENLVEFLKSVGPRSKDYSNFVNEIVRILNNHFATELGEAEFDVESYEIDENGNHLRSYTGFEHFQMTYEPKTNRVSQVIYRDAASANYEEKFAMSHDSCGNVVRAMHKRIHFMEYHPVSKRLQSVVMTNGNVVSFSYDSKGERVLKKLENVRDEIISEMHYIRDSEGRTLVERNVRYVERGQPPDILVTMYIYGPRSLVGFVRRNQFYSVITDHQGSTRLVIRDGEVVAAYDYMPYGSFMRVYGSDPDAHIPYRFTGQEWDPELELYNYHARMYDPSIGRFYQIDPMSQYFSPYIYADNSPVSMVDPNGEIAFLVALPYLAIAGFSMLGAYLGGSGANNNFDPVKWDWSKTDTYLGIATGGFIGAFLPSSVGASVLLFESLSLLASTALSMSVGIATAYLSVAATTHNWDRTQWNWKSATNWNAAFQGFALGFNLLGGFKMAVKHFIQLSSKGRAVFGTLTAASGSGMFALSGELTNWDIKKPEFWFMAITSVFSAAHLPMFLISGIETLFVNRLKVRRGIEMIKDRYFYLALTKEKTSFLSTISSMYRVEPMLPVVIKSAVKFMLMSLSFGLVGYTLSGAGQWDLTSFSSYFNLMMAIQLKECISLYNTRPIISASSSRSSLFTIGSAESLRSDVTIFATGSYKKLGKLLGAQTLAGSEETLYNFASNIPHSIRSRSADSDRIPLRTNPQKPLSMRFSNSRLLVNYSNSLLLFTRNRIVSPIILTPYQAISRQYDPHFVEQQTEVIAQIPNILQHRNNEELKKPNNVASLFEIISKETFFSNETIRQYMEAVQKLFESTNGQIERNQIAAALEKINLDNYLAELMRAKYQSKENELLSGEMNVVEKRNLEKEIKIRKINEKLLLADQKKTLIDIIWKELMVYKDFLTKWDRVQFTPVYANDSRLVLKTSNPNAYDGVQDLHFLPSIKSENLPELITFKNCYSCISEALQIRNTPADFEWLEYDNENVNQRDVFLRPLANESEILESIELEESAKREALANWRRNRRSIVRPTENVQFTKTIGKIESNDAETATPNSSSNATWNFCDLIDNYLHRVTNNATLLLTDVLLAKFCRRQLSRTPDVNGKTSTDPVTQIQAFACDFVEIYEKSLRTAAETCQIASMHLNLSNSFDLYNKIADIVAAKRFDQVQDLMSEYALDAISSSQLSDDEQQIFLESFLSALAETNEIFNKIFAN